MLSYMPHLKHANMACAVTNSPMHTLGMLLQLPHLRHANMACAVTNSTIHTLGMLPQSPHLRHATMACAVTDSPTQTLGMLPQSPHLDPLWDASLTEAPAAISGVDTSLCRALSRTSTRWPPRVAAFRM